ncbi:MAG: hypothetical protein WBV06_10080 [Acidimicrobiia bacterium]|jgi:hypothetical protein
MSEAIAISIELEETDAGVDATGALELSGKTYRMNAHAPENHSDDRIAYDLAVVRVLRGLEIGVMEWIHEHIDRYVEDE